MSLLAVGGLIVLAWVIVVPRLAARRQDRESKTLLDVRRRLWSNESREPATELLERSRFVFVSMPGWEQRLDHRLEDEAGAEIGSCLEQPRPRRLSKNGPRSRFSTVRVEIRDKNDLKQIEIVRSSGIRPPPLEIFDGSGALVGTVARDGRRSFAVLAASGARIGTIARRSRGYAVDYALMDSSGAEVGSISDFAHLTERASGPVRDGTTSFRRKVFGSGQPEEHVLELQASVSGAFRSLMLGAAASVYLVLQKPFQDSG